MTSIKIDKIQKRPCKTMRWIEQLLSEEKLQRLQLFNLERKAMGQGHDLRFTKSWR